MAHPGSGADAVAAAVAAPRAAASRAPRTLETELPAIRIAGRPVRWSVDPPRASLAALLASRQQELARAELQMERLHEVCRSVSRPRATPHLVEVLESPEEVSARCLRLLRTSRHTVLHLAKPPYVTAVTDGPGPVRPAAATVAPVADVGAEEQSAQGLDGRGEGLVLPRRR